MAKIVVGLSGGVDSSVAAYLLKEQGHEVIGLFMRNWDDTVGTLSGDCPWREDRRDAMRVAAKLDIPFHTVDLVDEYKKRIVDYMFTEYEKGRTPNPDVLCNREIKFDVFLKKALDFGADYVATGHYCRKAEVRIPSMVDKQRSESCKIRNTKGEMRNDLENSHVFYRLLAGRDPQKDQSYFLCQLSQEQLAYALFPIGELLKLEVRAIAKNIGLETAEKKDSQGLCFIGKVDLPQFLQQKLQAKKGNIIEIPRDFYERSEIPRSRPSRDQKSESDKIRSAKCEIRNDRERENTQAHNLNPQTFQPEDGHKVGEHNGAHFFTIGQRKGLDVGGTEFPLFVIDTDVKNNIVYVGQGTDHPALYRQKLSVMADDMHWVRPDLKMKIGEEREYMVRVRYRQPLQKAVLRCETWGLNFEFEEAQRAIAPGQFVAWYDGEELIGSGVIAE